MQLYNLTKKKNVWSNIEEAINFHFEDYLEFKNELMNKTTFFYINKKKYDLQNIIHEFIIILEKK